MLAHIHCYIALSLALFISKESCDFCNRQEQVLCAPNTISLNPKICMDLTEVPAYMYKDFLQSIAEKSGTSSEMFRNMSPDFAVWTDIFQGKTAEELKDKFFESDELALMPIIGISYEQALAFMDWRTESFKIQLSEMNKRDRAQYPKDFIFRLPTKKEWGLMRFRGQEQSVKKQLRKMGDKNQKAFKLSKSKLMKEYSTIHDIYFESDNRIGFFNVYDNVSEMTSEKGLAVGGSWNEANPGKQYAKEFPYQGPNAWTGFRCVMEILD